MTIPIIKVKRSTVTAVPTVAFGELAETTAGTSSSKPMLYMGDANASPFPINPEVKFSLGSIPFENSLGYFAEDNTNFWYDSANKVLNIKKIKSTGSVPTITSGAGAGSAGSLAVSIVGTDMNGTITLMTGNAPSANAIMATITFNSPFTTVPRISLTPGSQAASGGNIGILLGGVIFGIYVNKTTTTFTIFSAGTALPNTSYVWDYFVTQ